MKSSGKLIYSYIKYLWIFVLMPKELQFIVYAVFLLYMGVAKGKTLKIDRMLVPFLVYAFVHLFSIVWNIVVGEHSIVRILAAVNTCLIWMVAICYFGIADEADIDYDYVGKLFARNIIILFGVMIGTRILGITEVNLGLETRVAWRRDWITTGKTLRFRGFFEFDTLVGLFVILQLPLAIVYVQKYKSLVKQIIFLILSVVPVVATLSRMGMFLAIVELLVAFWYVLNRAHISNNQKRNLKVLVILFVILLGGIFSDEIIAGVKALIYLRKGSSSARSNIYLTSISMTVEKSPLIGMGIKEMLGNYPLGSHCTYIGIFYKTGVIGVIVWGLGLFNVVKQLFISGYIKSGLYYGKFVFWSSIIFLFYLFTEDLDGANWLIVMFFVCMSLYTKTDRK